MAELVARTVRFYQGGLLALLKAPARAVFSLMRQLPKLEAQETLMQMAAAMTPFMEAQDRRRLVTALEGAQERSAYEGLADLRDLIDALGGAPKEPEEGH